MIKPFDLRFRIMAVLYRLDTRLNAVEICDALRSRFPEYPATIGSLNGMLSRLRTEDCIHTTRDGLTRYSLTPLGRGAYLKVQDAVMRETCRHADDLYADDPGENVLRNVTG